MKIDFPRSAEDKVVSSPNQKFRLTIIFGFFLLVGLNSGGFGVILPAFSLTYGLTKGDSGWLFAAITIGYLSASLTGSWVSARFGLRNFLISGLLLFGAGSLALWLLPPLGVALLARLVLGLAGAALETGGNFYVAYLPNNTAILNYLHALFGAGALIGPLVASWILDNKWGWQNLFLVWLVATLVLAIGFRLAFGSLSIDVLSSTPAEDKLLQTEEQIAATRNPMRQALKHPTIWLATIFLLVYVGGETVVGSWTYTFLTEGPRYSTTLSGWLVSTYWIGLTLGRVVLGWLIARPFFVERNRLVFISCILISIIGAGQIWLASEQPLIVGMGLFLIGFGYGPIYPTTLAILSRIVDPHLISSAISLIIGLSILGVTIFPWIAGSLLESGGLATLFPYIMVLGVIMVGVVLLFLRPAAKSKI